MAGIHRVGLGAVLSMAFLAGCSGNSSTNATATASPEDSKQADVSANPIAKAASEWLDAILKGDKQRASARLTPQARQQIITNDMEFSPPGGVETTTFQITDVRTPSQDQAIAQCLLSFTAAGKQRSEELCCLLRFVDNDWRVAGIAYGTAPDKPWVLTNFETGQDVPVPRQAMSAPGQTAQDGNSGGDRPSPRTAQEPAAAERR